MIVITDSRCIEYGTRGHPERPQRISRTIDRLKNQKEIQIDWECPLPVNDVSILRAHSDAHLQRVSEPVDFDADTPAYPLIAEHARRSVGAALKALEFARHGKIAFSLMRPPGHHAERNQAMGFCYFNQIAIAALEAVATGFKRVAIYDFDVHHGNGTEEILMQHSHCTFFSIHQYPAYPGTGARSLYNCYNYPVPPGIPRGEYRGRFEEALAELQQWKPDLVAVSAGFDAYRGDPLSEESLEIEDFHWLGQSIRNLQIPSFHVLEGGYSLDLPELILAYLKGLEGLSL